MEDKQLYKNYSKYKNLYNLNAGYWKRKLQTELKSKLTKEDILFENKDVAGNKLYDANPIFTYYNKRTFKAIRIIQDSEEILNIENIDSKFLIDAWLDKIEFESENGIFKCQELVIALVLTESTVKKSMLLIARWLRNDLNSESIRHLIGK